MNIINFIKCQRFLRKIIREEKLLEKLSASLNAKFKRDWIGRIYTIINPEIQNIRHDGSGLIYDGDGKIEIEKYIMDNLNIIRHFIKDNILFDILSYDIKKIDDDNNYLIIFKNIYLKSFIREMGLGLGIIIFILILILVLL